MHLILAEPCRVCSHAATLTRGSQLQVIGQIQNRDYVAKDGTKSVTEIRVQRIVRLEPVAIWWTGACVMR